MTARLGNVLYWAGCIIAALIVFGAWGLINSIDDPQAIVIVTVVPALLVWLVGRAMR
jgi:hypothetical protein